MARKGTGITLVKVSIFAAVSAVLTVLLGMKIANTGLFGATYEVEAVFSNASGVFSGDAVKLAGVDVGRVKDTRIEGGNAVVTFEVDEGVTLTTESQVAIRWRNVIGLRFLYVFPGEGGEPLQDGDRIPIENTDDAGDIGAFLNELGPILQAIDPAEANAFLDAMNEALGGNEATVRVLLSSGANLARELGDMDKQIKSLIGSSDRIIETYANQDDAFGSIIDDLNVVGGKLSGMTDTINSVLVNFATVQEELDRLLKQNRGNIDASLSGLLDLSRLLSENRGKLERTLCTLPAGIVSYDQTSSWGEWFNVRIVEIVFKDSDGNPIVDLAENDDQRGGVDRPVLRCPEGSPVRQHLDGGPYQRPPGPQMQSQDLSGWMDTVSGGAGG